ncbi:MAG: 1-acyl-sn-glycerol-3-phosphate acyltransferase [Pseudomonadota bacterium]
MDAAKQPINTLKADKSAKQGAQKNGDKHIVEVLIEERAETLVASPLWPLYRSVLYPLLQHRAAVRMADAVTPLSGWDAMRYVSRLLSLKMTVNRLERVPETGRVILAPNHPTGIADGIAMFDALKTRRSDMTFFANRDAVRVVPQLRDLIIPVEWVEEKRTRERSRETLAATKEAFADERCVVLFPSGRLAFMDENKVLTERDWMTSIAIFARKYECTIVPVHIRARNSWLYYWFWRLNTELRDITLFNELLNKRGKPFDITFGAPIPPSALKGDADVVTAALRRHTVEDVLPDRPWMPVD